MLKNKIIKLLSVVGIISILIGGLTIYKELNKVPSENQEIVCTDRNNAIIEESAIIEELNKVGRLEVMQCQIGKKITISNNSKLEWFKKETTIDYKVMAHYYLDLTKCSISVNNNVLTIYVNKPIIIETNILYDLTKVSTNNGCLAFNELKLEPNDQLQIENDMCKAISKECEDEIDTTKSYAEDILEKLLIKIDSNILRVKVIYTIDK